MQRAEASKRKVKSIIANPEEEYLYAKESLKDLLDEEKAKMLQEWLKKNGYKKGLLDN